VVELILGLVVESEFRVQCSDGQIGKKEERPQALERRGLGFSSVGEKRGGVIGGPDYFAPPLADRLRNPTWTCERRGRKVGSSSCDELYKVGPLLAWKIAVV
jgi:hypothetical protein